MRRELVITLQLSLEEAKLLCDILDSWIEGYEDATSDVVNDRSAESAEQYLRLVNGMVMDFDASINIRTRIREVLDASTGKGKNNL